MPYIKSVDRTYLDDPDAYEPYTKAHTPGELNYLLTQQAWGYFKTQGRNYQAINDVLGALEGAKLEFYRRVAAPYEDGKIKENGDVYL